MPFGIPYFPPPTPGGRHPHIRGFCSPLRGGNPRSIFYELQVCILEISNLCFTNSKSMFYE